MNNPYSRKEDQVTVVAGQEVPVSGWYSFLRHVNSEHDGSCKKHCGIECPEIFLKGMPPKRTCIHKPVWRLVARINDNDAYRHWKQVYGPPDDRSNGFRRRMDRYYDDLRISQIDYFENTNGLVGVDVLLNNLRRHKPYAFIIQAMVTQQLIGCPYFNVVRIENQDNGYDVDIETGNANIQVWFGDITKSELELFSSNITENPDMAIERYRYHGPKKLQEWEWDKDEGKCVSGIKYNMKMLRKKLDQLPPNKLGILLIIGRVNNSSLISGQEEILNEYKRNSKKGDSERCILNVSYLVSGGSPLLISPFSQKHANLSAPAGFVSHDYIGRLARDGIGCVYTDRSTTMWNPDGTPIQPIRLPMCSLRRS